MTAQLIGLKIPRLASTPVMHERKKMKCSTARLQSWGMIAIVLVVLQGCQATPPLQPAPADPPGGGGGSGSVSSPCPSGPNQCLGAIAINCDGVVPNSWPAPQVEGVVHAGCFAGWCWINAGSWAHDQCCVTTPGGRWCGGPLSAFISGCVASWDRAIHRLQHGLNWSRRVDMCRVDNDGIVNFSEYCAPNGTVLAQGDQNRCCSGLSREYSAATDAAQANAQGVTFDASFTPVVCRAPPAKPPAKPSTGPKLCSTQAQCASDEICIAPSSSTGGQKRCLKL